MVAPTDSKPAATLRVARSQNPWTKVGFIQILLRISLPVDCFLTKFEGFHGLKSTMFYAFFIRFAVLYVF